MVANFTSLATTGIGSLPHVTVPEAVEQAFRVDLPFLPQLPMRDPREFMLPQATEGVPGIVFDESGTISLDVAAWKKGRGRLEDDLYAALEKGELGRFRPAPASCAAFEDFVRRVRERRAPAAKVQIAGPLTAQWSLRTTDGDIPPAPALTHVSRVILARSLAMVHAIREAGAEPVCFLDEPGLYAFSRTQPRHILMLQDLRINAMALKKAGARVGVHCCSDADWGSLLGLGIDVLSIDVRLSLRSLLRSGEALVTFVSMGGRLALGVIPTSGEREDAVEALYAELTRHLATLEQYFPTRASIMESILGRSLLTPACGLALLGREDAEHTLDQLRAFQRAYRGART